MAWFGSSGSGVIAKDGQLCGVLSAIGAGTARGKEQMLETINIVEAIDSEMISKIRKAISVPQKNNIKKHRCCMIEVR